MNYKMIFSDMDGTLLSNDFEISPANKNAILQAKEKGVGFVLCTGRGFFGVKRHADLLGLTGQKGGYAICQNGSTVYDLENLELSVRQSFTPSVMNPISKMATEMGLEMYYYDNQLFMATEETERIREYCRVMSAKMRLLVNPGEYEGEFTKCLVNGPREKLLKLRSEMAHLEESELDCYFSGPMFMEYVKKGVSKGNAMEQMAKDAGITLEQVIAIGDSDNDISMIRRAGMGVAVANADESVKRAADYVTTTRCDQDAVSEVIRKFIL